MAVQGFFDNTTAVAAQQFRLRLFVVADADIQVIDTHTWQGNHALPFDFGQAADLHLDRLAGSSGQVLFKAGLQRIVRLECCLVQRVQVQLE
ncbi:hypothetical protein D9M71_833210 [compost metagenome]